MTTVVLKAVNANTAIDIVRELRESGLIQGVDFDFEFCQSKWDSMIGETPRETKFIFYSEKHATMFVLKYSGIK
jgi:hypothetical protein